MKQLLLSLLFGVTLTACGGSSSSPAGGMPSFSKVNPPTGGTVVSTTELEQILSGSIEKQFTRGLYLEMNGSSTMVMTIPADPSKGTKDINLTCPSQIQTKVVSLGIINQKIYLYTDTTLIGGGLSFDSTSNQYACETNKTNHLIAVHLTALPASTTELITSLFTSDSSPDQTVTYYDQGNTFAVYLAEKKNDPNFTTDEATLITFQNPRTTPLLAGMLSATGSEDSTVLNDSKLVAEYKVGSTITTTSAGTLSGLSSIAAEFKNVKVCEGLATNEVCSDQDLSYLAQ